MSRWVCLRLMTRLRLLRHAAASVPPGGAGWGLGRGRVGLLSLWVCLRLLTRLRHAAATPAPPVHYHYAVLRHYCRYSRYSRYLMTARGD